MEYIYLGRVANTHGIKGEIRLLSNFKYKNKVFKKDFIIYIGKEKVPEQIKTYRVHKQFDMITMSEYTNINEVLKYKGKPVYIKREDLHLTEDEYLDEDLIGLNVIVNNDVVGKVTKIKRDKYQDKIVVNKDEKEYLVPYVCDIILKINLQDNSLTLAYIKGLLD